MMLAGTCWVEQSWNSASPDVSSGLRNHLCECEAVSDVSMAYQTNEGDRRGDMKSSVRVMVGGDTGPRGV